MIAAVDHDRPNTDDSSVVHGCSMCSPTLQLHDAVKNTPGRSEAQLTAVPNPAPRAPRLGVARSVAHLGRAGRSAFLLCRKRLLWRKVLLSRSSNILISDRTLSSLATRT